MVKINPNTAIIDLYVMGYYGILCIEDKTTGLNKQPTTRKVKGDTMKKYYYYSVIGKRATGETFMKIVCVETLYSAFRNSNTHIAIVVDYIAETYNIGITNINVLYSTNTKLNNMPNVDYIDRTHVM